MTSFGDWVKTAAGMAIGNPGAYRDAYGRIIAPAVHSPAVHTALGIAVGNPLAYRDLGRDIAGIGGSGNGLVSHATMQAPAPHMMPIAKVTPKAGGPKAKAKPMQGATSARTKTNVSRALSAAPPRPVGPVAPPSGATAIQGGWMSNPTGLPGSAAPQGAIPGMEDMGAFGQQATAMQALGHAFPELDPMEVYRQAQMQHLASLGPQALGMYSPGGSNDPYMPGGSAAQFAAPGYANRPMPYTSSGIQGGPMSPPGDQQSPALAAALALRNATADQLASSEFRKTLEDIMREAGAGSSQY